MTCRLVSNKSCGKLVLLVPFKFDDRLKVSPVFFLVTNFNFVTCESDSFVY